MPKIRYTQKKFKPSVLLVLDNVNRIIDSYKSQGFVLTLRQIFYQFIAKDLFPSDWIDEEYNRANNIALNTKNTEKNYKRLGGIVSDGRMAGLLDWSAIEDRTRRVVSPSVWGGPDEIIAAVASQFRIDKWSTQEYRPEVWIEKEALAGIIEPVCSRLGISYLACKGYLSQSEMWSSAMRMKKSVAEGQTPIVLHLGDHDPSGMDMSRDILDRIQIFMGGVKVDRLALNMDQVNEYNPPPNPAKTTDGRFAAYEKEFGDQSWELDALDPELLATLIEDAVGKLRDEDAWAEKVEEEEVYREGLAKASKELGQGGNVPSETKVIIRGDE